VISATCADIRIGGEMAFYAPSHDFIQVPPHSRRFCRPAWRRRHAHLNAVESALTL